ncbi:MULTISPECIES: hypothetical protein [unclassified Arthrobacter]|uniref:hypothetical protein n=1 Tax=unclassified Arthrobacter TaxID=235627 RepID=UPI001C849A25|nr:hypothetical protein [Arthrobacter sp. MAHUQ-56]MBX7444697.1 hypothetical protein [Arthrobacter sp. MAHUQ-56]
MGILIGLIVLVIVFFIAMYGVGGWIAIATVAGDSKGHKKAEENAPAILDEAFVGDNVVFKIHPRSPKYETVVLGAKARGYRLMNETQTSSSGSSKTLIFEKTE